MEYVLPVEYWYTVLTICVFASHILCQSVENIRDFVDSLLLTQKENIEAGEEEADRLTDSHLIQTVSDIYGGADINL